LKPEKNATAGLNGTDPESPDRDDPTQIKTLKIDISVTYRNGTALALDMESPLIQEPPCPVPPRLP
jgi:hypothetical protein